MIEYDMQLKLLTPKTPVNALRPWNSLVQFYRMCALHMLYMLESTWGLEQIVCLHLMSGVTLQNSAHSLAAVQSLANKMLISRFRGVLCPGSCFPVLNKHLFCALNPSVV